MCSSQRFFGISPILYPPDKKPFLPGRQEKTLLHKAKVSFRKQLLTAYAAASGLCAAPAQKLPLKMPLSLIPCQESACRRSEHGDRRRSDKQPLQCVKPHPNDCGFRVAVIPAQIRAVQDEEGRESPCAQHTDGDKRPMEDLSPRCFLLGKLQVYDLKLFRNCF